MNKIALGRKIVKCFITTVSNYLRTLDLKLFFRPTALLHRDTSSKNRCNKAVAMQEEVMQQGGDYCIERLD